MERCDEIEEQYLLALEADPNNIAVHSDYGNLLEEMGRYEEAEKQYTLALTCLSKMLDFPLSCGFVCVCLRKE
jgi:Tfp pilus assembly protein PilF